MDLPDGTVSTEFVCNARDKGSIPGLGRFPGEGNGNPFQSSCLGNPMDRGAWWASCKELQRVRSDWTRIRKIYVYTLSVFLGVLCSPGSDIPIMAEESMTCRGVPNLQNQAHDEFCLSWWTFLYLIANERQQVSRRADRPKAQKHKACSSSFFHIISFIGMKTLSHPLLDSVTELELYLFCSSPPVSVPITVCVLGVKSLPWCLSLWNPMDCSPPGSSVQGTLPGKNTGVGCHALLQGIFPTQGLNPRRFMSPVLVGRFFTTSTTCEALPSQDFLFILFTQDKIDNTFSQKINRWGQGEAGISYLFCFPILNNQYHFHNSEPSA